VIAKKGRTNHGPVSHCKGNLVATVCRTCGEIPGESRGGGGDSKLKFKLELKAREKKKKGGKIDEGKASSSSRGGGPRDAIEHPANKKKKVEGNR